jgi:hypothetical protein
VYMKFIVIKLMELMLTRAKAEKEAKKDRFSKRACEDKVKSYEKTLEFLKSKE